MMVNSPGISGYSASTFAPPSDKSVIIQSRGNEPVPYWIFATRRPHRRSFLRRFPKVSTLRVRW